MATGIILFICLFFATCRPYKTCHPKPVSCIYHVDSAFSDNWVSRIRGSPSDNNNIYIMSRHVCRMLPFNS